jgi:FtsH-binding integral membrane protein
MNMFKTVPWNYMYLFSFAGIFGFWLGLVCAQYTAASVILVFAISFVLVVALSAYAVCTKADFTGMGPYVLMLLLGLLMALLVGLFFRSDSLGHKLIGCAGATVFGFIIVYDTQLIFGSTPFGGKRKFEYTVDMYAFAAFNLYLDFINFFLYILRMLGKRN